jgi:hypothetical protein
MPDSYSMCQLGARPAIVSILSEQAEIANLRSNEGITSWVSSQRRIHMAVKQLARLTTKRNDEGKRVAYPCHSEGD